VFTRLDIRLTDPICNCSSMNLGWTPDVDNNGQYVFKINCKTCGTMIIVGHDQFVAGFVLDNPYPEGHVSVKGDKNKKEAKIIKLVPNNPEELKSWKAPS
jgi:hypothetical protein